MDTSFVIPIRKKRALFPKTRSGCLRCKARRVKCDEGKPECNRCLRNSGKCSGYAEKEVVTRRAVGFKLLLPSTQPLCRSPPQNLFHTDLECRFFERFCQRVVGQLTGVQNSELWTRVVLQASQSNEIIRHATIAMGALDFTGSRSGELRGFQKRFAYSEYHKALVGMRKSLEKDYDIRLKLIICILFACFEAYHGNSKSAIWQLYAGIEMMEEYTKKRNEPPITPYQTRLPPIDNEIEQVLILMEIQATAWGDQRSTSLHLERMQACAAIVENMPAEFDSTNDATYYLGKNMMRGIHLRFFYNKSHKKITSPFAPPFLNLNACIDGPALIEMGRVMAAFSQWGLAFAPLYRKIMSSADSGLQKGATLLKMHRISGSLWVVSGSPGAFRAYTKELREVVELSKVLIDMLTLEPLSVAPLDMVVVLPLSVVGWNYRHRALRREAIDILSTLARREAVWDSGMNAKIMEWMAEIEEEGLEDEEYVPEDVVANISNMEVDESQRTAIVSCLQGIKGAPGETVLKTKKLHW